MRHFYADEVEQLKAEPWQIALLAANPAYCSWGPHEDYMTKDSGQWDTRIIVPTWAEFGPWELNDLNECVNFYFEVNRAAEDCKTCSTNGYHPDAQGVVNTFYAHMNPAGEHWHDKITQDEADALVAEGRGDGMTTAEEFNAQNGSNRRGFFGHDAINRHILIRARLKRLGLPHHCPTCDGNGYVYTAPDAHVSLVLWWLHPRKGCSRGIEVTRIEQSDLPAIKQYLEHAAQRNAERFSGLSKIAP